VVPTTKILFRVSSLHLPLLYAISFLQFKKGILIMVEVIAMGLII
jgi:hypothetical protein